MPFASAFRPLVKTVPIEMIYAIIYYSYLKVAVMYMYLSGVSNYSVNMFLNKCTQYNPKFKLDKQGLD